MSTRSPSAPAIVLFTACALLLTLGDFQPATAQSADENWSNLFGEPGMGTGAREAVVVGSRLVVSDATYVIPGVGAGVDRAQLAVWDGTGWSLSGAGSLAGGDGINDMAAVGTDIYIAGNFTSVGGVDAAYIARWDGSAWQALGEGLNGGVNALASDGQNLYVGGTFTEAGGVPVRNVARWNGSEWSALTNGPASSEGVNGSVSAIAVGNSVVYVGGTFTEAGQQAATSIASWNPTTGDWGALGGGVKRDFFPDADIRDIGVSDGMVYVAGDMDVAMNDGGGVAVGNIAVFDGAQWSALGSGSDVTIGAMLVSPGGEVFASGDFGTGTLRQEGVARWTGGVWERLAPEKYTWEVSDIVWYDGAVMAIAAQSGESSTLRTNGIARWTGSGWAGLGHGIDDRILSITEHDGSVYVGGSFGFAGDSEIRSLARWDGGGWSQVGGGLPINAQLLQVTSLVSTSAGLVAAGDFDEIGGVSVTNIALWDGSSWNDMGGGLTNFGFTPSVHRLQVMDGELYAGGSFVNSNGTTVRGIAHWTGSEWEAVGGGAQSVETFAASDGRIVVGSISSSISVDYGPDGNDTPIVLGNVALWDGSDWTDVGGGVNGNVLALAFAGTDIIVGGSFSQAGAVPAANIARWDGSNWKPLGEGVDGTVRSLHVNGSDIWVGGDFIDASGTSARGAARWDGSEWHSAGSGLINITLLNNAPASVRAFAGTEDGLFMGGIFTRSERSTSQNIALWTDYSPVGVTVERPGELPVHGLTLSGNYPDPFSGSTHIRFELDSAAEVTLEVFDLLGRRVTLNTPRETYSPGEHDVLLDASGLATGMYIYRLTARSRTASGRFHVLR